MRVLFCVIVLSLFFAACTSSNKKQELDGYYEGYFEYKSKKLNLSLDFSCSANKYSALVSIPDNLLLDRPVSIINYNAPFLEMKMPDQDSQSTIHAVLHKNNIDGNLQGSIPASLHLTKIENYVPVAKDYKVEEVILKNNEREFSAALYLPKSNLPSPAVIIVSGSGNHKKEEYNGAAALFTSRGIATLVFDKRNVTSLPGIQLKHINSDIATMNDLVSDAEAALNFLKSRKDIRQDKIGLLGFSLGAVEVPVIAATHPEIAFVVAVSGNATTDKEFVIDQGLNRYRKNGYDSFTIEKAGHLYSSLFNYAKDKLNGKTVQLELDKAFEEKWGQLSFSPELPDDNELKYLLTWNNFEFDSAVYWKRISVPCLIIYGEKDKYIPVERSIEILKEVFSPKKELLTLKVYKDADHSIRIAPDKNQFGFPKYADGYTNDMVSWILESGFRVSHFFLVRNYYW